MNEKTNGWIFFLVFLGLLFWYSDHSKLVKQIEELQDDNSSLTYALDQANSNIEDAQSYAWSSYEDMGYALDSLETVYQY